MSFIDYAAMKQADDKTFMLAADAYDKWAKYIPFGEDFRTLLHAYEPRDAVREMKNGFVLGENIFIYPIKISKFTKEHLYT